MPAELLIKAVDGPLELGFKKGDVVEVRQVGDTKKGNASEVCLPKFLIITVTGISFENAKKIYLESISQVDLVTGKRIMIAKRKHKFDIDTNLTAAELTETRNSDWLVRSFSKSLIVEKS